MVIAIERMLATREQFGELIGHGGLHESPEAEVRTPCGPRLQNTSNGDYAGFDNEWIGAFGSASTNNKHDTRVKLGSSGNERDPHRHASR
jgi:hypothetical protein